MNPTQGVAGTCTTQSVAVFDTETPAAHTFSPTTLCWRRGQGKGNFEGYNEMYKERRSYEKKIMMTKSNHANKVEADDAKKLRKKPLIIL